MTSLKNHCASLELVPGKGGCFEVARNGDLVYSKLATGEFPDEDTILSMMQA